jgi:hypothetical protein
MSGSSPAFFCKRHNLTRMRYDEINKRWWCPVEDCTTVVTKLVPNVS